MTTEGPPSGRQPAGTPSGSDVPAARRGTLRVDRRVVERIAAHAAGTVSAAGGTSGGFLGVGATRDFHARPDVEVSLTGGTVTLGVRCGLAYPAPLRESTQQVRRHIIEEVERLTGLDVNRVDIDVRWLSRTDRGVRRHLA